MGARRAGLRFVDERSDVRWWGASGGPDDSTALQAAIDAMGNAGGGLLEVPELTFNHTGLTPRSGVVLRGTGRRARLHNIAVDGSHAFEWAGSTSDRLTGFWLERLRISGNGDSGDAVHFVGYSSPYSASSSTGYAAPCGVDRCTIDGHGGHGVYFAGGDHALVQTSYIFDNEGSGIVLDGSSSGLGSNAAQINGNVIERNGAYGIRTIWIASTVSIVGNGIHENVAGGVFGYASDTIICHRNAFNRNTGVPITVNGIYQTGQSMRLVDHASIMGNLFGDNATGPMISVATCRSVAIDDNTFYKVNEPGESACIKIGNLVYGVHIGHRNQFFGSTEPKAALADDGGAITNETTAATSIAASDMTLLPAAPAVDDAYYFGCNEKFSALHLQQGVQGVGTWTIVWEYYNGATWSGLSTHTISDTISGFTGSVGYHQIRFRLPIDWATTTVGGVVAFYIRARVSAFTSITTQPKGTNVWFLSRARTLVDTSALSEGYYTFADGDADEGSIVYRHHSSTAIPLATQVNGEQFRRWQLRENGQMDLGPGTSTFDSYVKRVGSAIVALSKLGVGNSSATTPDVTGTTKARKIQVYDDTGASIGYLQVYAGPGV
jgi:hypothetical protein